MVRVWYGRLWNFSSIILFIFIDFLQGVVNISRLERIDQHLISAGDILKCILLSDN